MSTQTLTELPRIMQAGMDFDTVLAEMKNILTNNPNWASQWSDFYESEAGVLLMELMAWVADNMSTKQDVLINELFLSTAQNDKNKLKLLKQIAYNPRLASAAKVAVTVEFDNLPTSYVYAVPPRNNIANRASELLSFTGKDINGNSINWELMQINKDDGKPNYLDSVILNSGSMSCTTDNNGQTLYALQGTTKYQEETTESSDGCYFNLSDKNIAADSIRVYIKSSMQKLMEVSSFVTTDALDTRKPYPYVVETNLDRTLRIRFANKAISSDRLLPAGTTISIFYRTTNGSIGNVNPGFINASKTLKDDNGATWNATITNELLANGGNDEESTEDAVLNGPLTLRTMDRAVTASDYNIILNNNANIFKSKTYTSSTQPYGFLKYYGRYINPQEAFSIVMLNKNYKDVPASKYNNFPWMILTKEPMLNEKYIFDPAAYNIATTLSSTYYNLTVLQTDSTSKSFSNATIISIPDLADSMFDENGNENNNLKLKLEAESNSESFFGNILFNVLYPDSVYSAMSESLTMGSNYLANDENARFVSSNTYNNSTPIDVNNGRYLNVSIDGKTPMLIDLWVDRAYIEDIEAYNGNEYYLCWTNEGDAEAKSKYGLLKTKEAAYHRNGIVEIINQSFAVLGTEDSDYAEYFGNTSLQYFGLKQTNEAVEISYLPDSCSFTLKINGTLYTFDYDADLWNEVVAWQQFSSDVKQKSIQGLAACLNYVFTKAEEKMKQIVDGEEVPITTNPFVKDDKLILNAYYTEIVNTDTDDDDVVSTLSNVSVSCDLVIKATDSSLLKSLVYTDSEGFSHQLEKVLVLDDEYVSSDYTSFIRTVTDTTASVKDIRNILPEPAQAATYDSIASFEKISEDENETIGWFKITSPIKGLPSCVYFKYDNNYSNDFMKNIMGLFFNSSGYSYKAYGIKKIYLMKQDAARAYTTLNGNEGTISDSVATGNVIFQNSCIYNNHDFASVYANYTAGSNNSLVIGSVNENFYYSGDADIDELLKKDTVGIEGQYMTYDILSSAVKSYYIDENKCEFDIRFTKDKVDTNSLYAITTDVDVIPCDRVKILTNCINGGGLGYITIQFDNYDPLTINLSSCKNGAAVVNTIKKAIKNSAIEDLINNQDTIVKSSYTTLNQVQLQSLSKNDSKIVLYYPEDADEMVVQNTYKMLLGTNLTNPDFYDLYPKDGEGSIRIDTDCVISVENEDEAEYFYCPTADKSVTIPYRKLCETTNEDGEVVNISRAGDYYITISGAQVGDQMSYRFNLVKTDNSQFPDTYFYMHFINDKTYNFDENGKAKETDEKFLQAYMDSYKISGTDIYFLEPYFKAYDIAATISYNANFSEADITAKVNDAVEELCDITKAQIAVSMSRAKILKAIMNIDGVEDCKITYFGYDYAGGGTSYDVLEADFYEILCLKETTDTTGKIFTFESVSD